MIYPTNPQDWAVRSDIFVAAKNLPDQSRSNTKTSTKELERFQAEHDSDWYSQFPRDSLKQAYQKRVSFTLRQKRLKELYWLSRAIGDIDIQFTVPKSDDAKPIHVAIGQTELMVAQSVGGDFKTPCFIAEDR